MAHIATALNTKAQVNGIVVVSHVHRAWTLRMSPIRNTSVKLVGIKIMRPLRTPK